MYILITICYLVSGANMNACVSLALWFYEEEFVLIHIIRRISYIFIIQPLGIFVGQMLSIGVIGTNITYIIPFDTDPFKIAFCEFFWTGAFMFVALHCIVSRYTRPFGDYFGLNIGFFLIFLYFASLSGENISGASYNPTKYLITQAIAYYRGIEPNAFKNWYCYVFPQFFGTICFTLLFKYSFDHIYYRMHQLRIRWEIGFFQDYYE